MCTTPNVIIHPFSINIDMIFGSVWVSVRLGGRNAHDSLIGRKIGQQDSHYLCVCFAESRLEGWLSVPNKQNIRRHGWKRQYVVVSSKKIIFYNSESDKQNTDPVLILDLKWVTVLYCFTVSLPLLLHLFTWPVSLCYSKVFHVRSVTQGDVIRADAKDIPRIFQVRAIRNIWKYQDTKKQLRHWLNVLLWNDSRNRV
jgi:hypothetical protein